MEIKAYKKTKPTFNVNCTIGKEKKEHWRKLQDNEFHGSYFSFNILRMI
jgi:hypothetical protein